MKIPASFYAFKRLVESPLKEVDFATPNGKEKSEKLLSFSCDQILSAMHSNEDYRSSTVGSNANLRDNSILLIINPEFTDFKGLIAFIKSIDCVGKVAVGSKKHPVTGEDMRLLKIQITSNNSEDKRDDSPLLSKTF